MIRGFVELVGPKQIRGWALRSDSPEEPIEVVATIAGRCIGAAPADVVRRDLSIAGFGVGRHGFVLDLEHGLNEAEQAVVAVHTTDEIGSSIELPRLKPSPAVLAAAESERVVAGGLRRPEIRDLAHRPVFVLGAARSGTSALAQGLLTATSYAGQEEGHLLDLVIPLAAAITSHYRDRGQEWSERETMIARVPQDFLQDWRRHLLVDLARQLFPSGRWLDKTPRVSMITSAPELRNIWPNACFIYMRRRALENLRSRAIKFPTITFEDHCRDWADSLSEWRRVVPSLAGNALEIDQHVLAREPERVAGELAIMLGLPHTERIRLAETLRDGWPERTAADVEQPLSLAGIGWTSAQRRTFERTCGDVMRAYGYADNEAYYLEGAAAAALRRY